jgi:hypothetical protein
MAVDHMLVSIRAFSSFQVPSRLLIFRLNEYRYLLNHLQALSLLCHFHWT